MSNADPISKPLREATSAEMRAIVQAVVDRHGLAALDLMPPGEFAGEISIGDFAGNVDGIVEQLLEAAKGGKHVTRSKVDLAGENGSVWAVGIVEDAIPPKVTLMLCSETQSK